MPHRLTYDNLPAHSQLRREFAAGRLKIVAAAEEPGPLVRRAALLGSAVSAALICFVVLLIGLAIFGATFQASRRTMPSAMSLVLLVAFVIFCMALFGLVWRVQYFARLDIARNALKQNTILSASPGRLLIETSGPLGSASHDLRSVRSLRRGRCEEPDSLDCLEIVVEGGSAVRVLVGRDRMELAWVARALASALATVS